MTFSTDTHRRRSIRLKSYDYSLEGAYFVTVVCQNRENLFGTIKNSEMVLNDAGKMVELWWCKIPEKFPHTEIDEFVIMPNHFHAVLSIVGANPCIRQDVSGCSVGVNPCIHPDVKNPDLKQGDNTVSPLRKTENQWKIPNSYDGLGQIISWFKRMSTNEYIRNVKENSWPPFNKSVWQKNYYEHVIRNESDLHKIREYIIYNPANWDSDDCNPAVLRKN